MQRFALKVGAALKLAFQRQWTLFLRNKAFLIFRTVQARVQSCSALLMFAHCQLICKSALLLLVAGSHGVVSITSRLHYTTSHSTR